MFEIVESIIVNDFIGHLDFYIIILLCGYIIGYCFFRS